MLDRVEVVNSEKDVATAEAALGSATRPKLKLIKAFDLYVAEIAASEAAGKSPAQWASWEKVKLRAVKDFIKVVGDIPLENISREDACKFYKWWLDRVTPGEGRVKLLSPSSANRDLGNMRKLYAEYFKYLGEDDRQNPFRGLSFAKRQNTERAAFSTEWIAGHILKVGALDGLNLEARLIAYILIETGARPSEICNLLPENIRLNSPTSSIPSDILSKSG